MNMWKHIVIWRKWVILYSAKCFLDWLGSIHRKWRCQRKDKPRYLCVNFLKRFVYFWLCWVSIAVHGLSLVQSCGRYSLVVVHGLLIAMASFVSEHRLQAHGLQQLCHTDLVAPRYVGSSWTRAQSVSPVLAGGFLSTVPPGKPLCVNLSYTQCTSNMC